MVLSCKDFLGGTIYDRRDLNIENLMSFLVSLRKSSFRILFLKCGKSGHNHHTLQKFCFLLLKNLLPSFFSFYSHGNSKTLGK